MKIRSLTRNAVWICVLMTFITYTYASLYRMERGSSLQLQCPGDDEDDTISVPTRDTLDDSPGKPGKRGPQGPPGPPGDKEPDSELRRRYEDRISELEQQLEISTPTLGTYEHPAKSCHDIKQANTSADNRLYYLIDQERNIFFTYCDMNVRGGGWTLVASVHENNMKGKCTSGDRWSSEQGNSAAHPHGDGFWENRAVHGCASSSTSDDYKNVGYFGMQARDVMIWHVPNDTPMKDFEEQSFLKYYTTNGFLQNYGDNLQKLFSKHYPMKSKTYTTNTDNGPAIPVTWEQGNNAKMIALTPVNSRSETDAGYIQFRAINNERNAFALCPGVRMKPSKVNAEHVCIRSTSSHIGHANEEDYCGDFAAKDWTRSGNWNAPEIIQKSVVMIFYR